MNLLSTVIDLLFPTRCVVCGALNPEPLCLECLVALPRITPPICARCGKPCALEVDTCSACGRQQAGYSILRSLALLDGPMRDIVHALKYANGRRLAPVLAAVAAERIEAAFFDVDLVTYVPLHRTKRSERGYNQSELIARAVSSLIGVPVVALLRQVRPTADQSQLTAEQRARNVKGAYEYRPAPQHHEALGGARPGANRVLLVDDVFTTGATVTECSRVLAAAGRNDVRVLTLARAEHVLESSGSPSRSVVASNRTSPG